ncbi:MAG TPA: hypothetical protein VJ717_01725 [Gemmatimonadaceae bacterium]|nr:hypothetical protein [Gemmatimonadaceae bacterium]
MLRNCIAIGATVAAVACGGETEAPRASQQAAAGPVNKLSACSLLTAEEVKSVTGQTVIAIDSTSAAGCHFRGPTELETIASIMVTAGMKPMATSAEMAAWRSGQIDPDDDIKPTIAALDGLGVPAIRNEIAGFGLVTIEVYKSGYLVDVTANTLELAKKLTPTVLSRVP